MKLTVPYKIRVTLYTFTCLGTPVIAYLLGKHIIGTLEVALWSAEVSAVMAMAGLNVTQDK